MHLVDTTIFFAPHSGGVKRYLLSKQRFLAGQPGTRHTIVVPGAKKPAPSRHGVVELPCLTIPYGGGYRIPVSTRAWTDALCDLQPDLIEAGDPYHVAWAALDAADRMAVPAVAFVHSDLSRLLAMRLGALAGAAIDRYLCRLYRRFDLVMAPSQSVATHLKDLGVERVVVQPLGVDIDIFHPSRRDPSLRAELGLSDDTRLLVYAGRISAEKRVPLLRRAVERLGRPYHLIIIGGKAQRRLSPLVTSLAYEQDPARLARLLASCDALVHAGDQETFGLVFLEMMACGRPVIGVRAGAVPEIIDTEVGRTAAPGNVDSLIQAIDVLYESDLEQLGAQARQRVERLYSWDQTLTLQLGRYANLVRRNAPMTETTPLLSSR